MVRKSVSQPHTAARGAHSSQRRHSSTSRQETHTYTRVGGSESHWLRCECQSDTHIKCGFVCLFLSFFPPHTQNVKLKVMGPLF